MKMILCLFLSLLSAVAWAKRDSETMKATLEGLPSCSNFIRFDEMNLYTGSGPYLRGLENPRMPIPGKIIVAPLGQPEAAKSFATLDSSIDVVTQASTLYVLTFSGLEVWDLKNQTRRGVYPTYQFEGFKRYKEHAEAFARYEDKLIIAHGRLGLSFFDMRTRKVTKQFRILQQQLPLESMATGVTVRGKYAFVSVADYTPRLNREPPAWRGLLIVDMDSESVVSELEGFDGGTDSILNDDQTLIVSYGGNPIWKYRFNDFLQGAKELPQPRLRLFKFPYRGHPVGHPAMDEKYYYTCFSRGPDKPGDGAYKKIPLALDRRVMRLD